MGLTVSTLIKSSSEELMIKRYSFKESMNHWKYFQLQIQSSQEVRKTKILKKTERQGKERHFKIKKSQYTLHLSSNCLLELTSFHDSHEVKKNLQKNTVIWEINYH